MKTIRVHRNPACRPCEQKSALTKKLDWLGRVDFSTEMPGDGKGELPLGIIAVQDLRTGAWFRGVDAMRKIFAQVPLYWPTYILSALPPVRRFFERLIASESRKATAACELPRREPD